MATNTGGEGNSALSAIFGGASDLGDIPLKMLPPLNR